MVSTDVWHVEHREEVLVLYGKVSVRWAALDLLLVQILSIALSNPSAARDLIFNGASFGKNRLETFNRAIGASRFTQDEREALLALSRKTADLLSARNDIVHSPLVINLSIEGNSIVPKLTRISRQGKTTELSITKIKGHIGAIGRVLSDLESLAQDLDLRYDPIDPDDR